MSEFIMSGTIGGMATRDNYTSIPYVMENDDGVGMNWVQIYNIDDDIVFKMREKRVVSESDCFRDNEEWVQTLYSSQYYIDMVKEELERISSDNMWKMKESIYMVGENFKDWGYDTFSYIFEDLFQESNIEKLWVKVNSVGIKLKGEQK